MKKIFVLVLSVLICSNVFAQRRLRYKDIFDKMGKEPVEHTNMKLTEFQKVNPEFPNTYLQMGVISWNWLQEEDPFLNYTYVKQLIYNTNLYLGLAKSKISADDKEVKKNKTYYTNFNITSSPDEVDQQGVLDYVNKMFDKAKEYEKNVTLIIENYNKAIDNYNNCIDIYRSIVARQNNYKNLLLTTDDLARKQFDDLALSFDSVMYYFNEFKTALGNYPIKDYDQKMKIIKIETYRLEGLTSSNFLQPEIPIWDYKTWVNDAYKLMDGDVLYFKDNAEEEIKSLRNRISALQEQKAETDSIPEIILPNKLVNLTEKYDYESLLSASIKYEISKANYQIASMRKSNNISNPEAYNESLTQKAAYYYDLYLLSKETGNALEQLRGRISDNNIAKQEKLVRNLYKGKNFFATSGIKEEAALLQTVADTNRENFQKFVAEQLNPENKTATFQGKTISIRPVETDFETSPNGYNTVYTIKDDAGNRYVSGYIKNSATSASGFVAKLNPENGVIWLTQLNAAPSGINKAVQVIPSKFLGPVVLVANSSNSGNKTTAIKLDASGKVRSKSEFSSNLYPVVCCYDEINEVVTAVFKGTKGNESDELDDCAVETVTAGQKTSDLLPEAFSLKGKIIDIIKTEGGNIVICNYKTVKVGKSSENAGSNIAAINIAGNTVSLSVYQNGGKDVKALKAFKLNAEAINILGSYDNLESAISDTPEAAYLIINNKGEFKN
ncbi:MAG: hypothetical protein II956_00905 [Bacteroidales bacterium]|nr:hypothetical protein [Bacteroidales bacterium]